MVRSKNGTGTLVEVNSEQPLMEDGTMFEQSFTFNVIEIEFWFLSNLIIAVWLMYQSNFHYFPHDLLKNQHFDNATAHDLYSENIDPFF